MQLIGSMPALHGHEPQLEANSEAVPPDITCRFYVVNSLAAGLLEDKKDSPKIAQESSGSKILPGDPPKTAPGGPKWRQRTSIRKLAAALRSPQLAAPGFRHRPPESERSRIRLPERAAAQLGRNREEGKGRHGKWKEGGRIEEEKTP